MELIYRILYNYIYICPNELLLFFINSLHGDYYLNQVKNELETIEKAAAYDYLKVE